MSAAGLDDIKTPRHVAIIMDGNGRWAAQRGLPRSLGHKAGVDALRGTVKAAVAHGVEYLTVYAFSTENWKRPKAEISILMELLKRFIRQDVADLHQQGVRIQVIGARDNLDPGILKMLDDAERLTQQNKILTLVVAFNYGGRQEITATLMKLAAKLEQGAITAGDITPELITRHLDTAGIPDPDLLIRTGGEQRISNFLLWQNAYTEFVFVDEFWPEFTAEVFARTLAEYSQRERRFGGLQAKTA